MSSDKKLNRPQLLAVNHRRGPLLIIAGAGTGKTTVITERIRRLIAKKLARPEEILALTFTEKAAKEMEDRLDRALPYGYTQMWVLTFHSFCDRILRAEGLHLGLSTDYRLLTTAGSAALLKKHILDLNLDYFAPLGNPNKFIFGLLDHFDRLRDEDVSPADYSAWVAKTYAGADSPEAAQYRELASVYAAFPDLKIKANSLDFADLIAETLRLFRTRPHLLTKYQDQFKYILVDEYQDTNYAQTLLVDLLAGKTVNLAVVADDDQAIFRFRGASVSNVLRFRRTYPGAKLISLTRNYRSTQNILDAAYRLIRHNDPDRLEVQEKIDKHLVSVVAGSGPLPKYLHYSRAEDEADGVAKTVSALLADDPKLHPGDIAVLVRANAHAQPFVSALSRRGIPAQFLGPARLFDQPEIKDLIALLQVIRDITDSPAFFRILSMDYFALPVRDLLTLSNHAQKQHYPLFHLCEDPGLFPPDFPAPVREKITEIARFIGEIITSSSRLTAGQVVYEFLRLSGLLTALMEYRQPVAARTAENIGRFFARLKNYEFENPDASVPAVLDWIDLTREAGESPAAADLDLSGTDSVNLLTLHSAKGLEFPVVFLVNLITGRFPSRERREPIPIPEALIRENLPAGDFHLQEERRLFYVGLTRARRQLFLTSADFYGQAKRAQKPSPFIGETLGPAAVGQSDSLVVIQPSLLDWQPPSASLSPESSRPQIKVTYLSYSQIQTFRDCPLHYKAKYRLRLPSLPSAASSFGNTIHQTMKDYYQAQSAGARPDILQVFSRNWTPEGYTTARHAQKYYDLGVRYLSEYLADRPFATTPAILEQPFTFRLGELKLGGKIDRADVLPDGTLEIIDYKTSLKALDTKAAARDLQLSFYALAATSIPDLPFNRLPGQVKLTLYYFATRQAVSVTQTADQLELAKQEILAVAKAIESSDFRCSGSLVCQGHCDFKILCDIYLNQ